MNSTVVYLIQYRQRSVGLVTQDSLYLPCFESILKIGGIDGAVNKVKAGNKVIVIFCGAELEMGKKKYRYMGSLHKVQGHSRRTICTID